MTVTYILTESADSESFELGTSTEPVEVFALAGNDSIDGGHFGDIIYGQDGNDQLLGHNGDDTILGGEGNDTIIGGAGHNRVFGDAGDDVLYITTELALADTVGGFSFGGTGDDVIFGSNEADFIHGDSGDDNLDARGGNDHIFGGAGSDTIYGNLGTDTIDGGAGVDLFDAGDDGINLYIDLAAGTYGVGGSIGEAITRVENVYGTATADLIRGSDGENTLAGREGNDAIYGSKGADSIVGGVGTDQLIGEAGDDTINGGTGSDTVTGGADGDVLTGGGAADTFIYTKVTDSDIVAASRDVIADFTHGSDKVDVSGIDADTDTPGPQDFVFGGAFTAGHIRAVQSGADTILKFNTDGDSASEMSILLQDVIATDLVDSDFVL